MYVKQIA